ncbi:hypothetical protein SPRG_00201 [Saprolegnia parasitica CBS 223.65]|uniref:Lysosomal Cystine Transporter n=1 Tax=Saprolegnia parasitica (strain CBS 223.65) TaxID=695850 RepID=A0A067D8L9_SAPPC|nr:hypothetical protein SPRG_00201 [Saprolegnia parasitica CBS 223.65]KDO35352.1 hypothetical protein SPRG_00201 [Saprolegnia parasitica CBS 223.65]|eukprot:XP_012193698.1 hypothetical protein SPRG_00201 [Saprolegnia parasitica CBS 223.65]
MTNLKRTLLALAPYGAPMGLAIILCVGLGLGFALDANANVPSPYNRISSVLGWMYFASWSLTFWPQIFVNWRRQSVVGMAIDFQVYNVPGFVGYAIYNACFYWNASVQDDYKALHGGHPNNVQINDVFFALHALAATLITLYQCAVYDRGNQGVSTTCWVLTSASICVCAAFYALVVAYIKLGVTLIKYTPQVYLNYTRESTDGYSIWGVLYDVLGGLLSIGQTVMDSATTDDWSAITGNPVKFALGLVVVFYDLVFMTQHYVLYPCGDAVDEMVSLLKKTRRSSLSAIQETTFLIHV